MKREVKSESFLFFLSFYSFHKRENQKLMKIKERVASKPK